MRVLLIEDDPLTAASVTAMLQAERCVVDATDLGEDGLEMAKLYAYDIIVLDRMLPDIDGYEVLRRLRAAKLRTPVLILSGMVMMEAKLRGFQLGADDFLTKPFDRRELIARLRAIVRRAEGLAQPGIRVGRLLIDPNRCVAEVDGERLPLTAKEYGILELLGRRKGSTVAKEVLLDHLYGGEDKPNAKIIDVFVCKLRKKISAATGRDDYIETAWGRGYGLKEPQETAAVA